MPPKKKSISEQIKDALISQRKLAKLINITDVDFTRKMQKDDFTYKELRVIEEALRIKIYEY